MKKKLLYVIVFLMMCLLLFGCGSNRQYITEKAPKEAFKKGASVLSNSSSSMTDSSHTQSDEVRSSSASSESDCSISSGDASASAPVRDSNPTARQQEVMQRADHFFSIAFLSYGGLMDQLLADFTYAEAKYAADNCGVDWNVQALKKAGTCLRNRAFSYDDLISELKMYKFTSDQAEYGVNNCGADWDEQAARKAAEYLSSITFTRKELIRRLKSDGFTSDQAEYGASVNGY